MKVTLLVASGPRFKPSEKRGSYILLKNFLNPESKSCPLKSLLNKSMLGSML